MIDKDFLLKEWGCIIEVLLINILATILSNNSGNKLRPKKDTLKENEI